MVLLETSSCSKCFDFRGRVKFQVQFQVQFALGTISRSLFHKYACLSETGWWKLIPARFGNMTEIRLATEAIPRRPAVAWKERFNGARKRRHFVDFRD